MIVIARYYDSNICRFINADVYVSTGQGILGCNMFAYCGNNSVNCVDYAGNAFVNMFGPDSKSSWLTTSSGTFSGGGAAVAITAIAIYSVASIKKESKELVVPFTKSAITSLDKKQAYFTQSPYDFNPKGLVRYEYGGSFNGKIIQWRIPGTNTIIFEWNEDIMNGSHYHILVNNLHTKDHRKPGEIVPEPYNTLYFGV